MFPPDQLRRGDLSVKYCPDRHCVGNVASKCDIDFQRSVYDDIIGWIPLWGELDLVDFKIMNPNNQLKVVKSILF